MGRYKLGKRVKRSDVWAEGGGLQNVVNELCKVDILNRETKYSSKIWNELSMTLFGEDVPKNRHWLWVTWTKNHKNVKELVTEKSKGPSSPGSGRLQDLGMAVSEPEALDHVETVRHLDSETNLESASVEQHLEEPSEREVMGETITEAGRKVWRKCSRVSKRFCIVLKKKQWIKIKPINQSTQLRQPWTQVLYKKFKHKNPCCTLAFKYQHVKPPHSRKKKGPYVHISAICTFPSCNAKYSFKINRKPASHDKLVKMVVHQTGKITHKVTEKKFRPAAYLKRGRIAKSLIHGPSHYFYRKLRSASKKELLAGNLTRCLNRNVLKVISSEVKRKQRLHDDILMEMHLTQTILKETDTRFFKIPGYIQHLSIQPFGVHMYTETGISILVQHLRTKQPVCLYLDATGGLVTKPPNQGKRVLYYSLTLPGRGRDTPPLPVCEMLSNEHSVPPISFWLMQFALNLSRYTQLPINQIETDYSWALIQSALIALNREHVSSYLERAYSVCRGEKRWEELKRYSVLHICSAHVLKAVKQAIARETSDNGLREFITFSFARLQNATSLSESATIFRALCTLLTTPKTTKAVTESVHVMESLILKTKEAPLTELPEEYKLEFCHEDMKDLKSIVASSPFSLFFHRLHEEVTKQAAKEMVNVNEENSYFCPGIVEFLFHNYLAIFPLWSGLLLGDLRRYAVDDQKVETNSKPSKTRDTNCHVEKWFGIVKQAIIKKKRVRPGTFVRTMFLSLEARYKEHILQHNLSPDLLLRPVSAEDITQSSETWMKRDERRHPATKSKFYSTPHSVPAPQKNKMKRSCVGIKEDTRPETVSKVDMCAISSEVPVKEEVDMLWQNNSTEVIVAIHRSADKNLQYLLHHRDFQTLRPHDWLVGEVIESYFRTILNSYDAAGKIFQLSHYITDVILHGKREQVACQGLRKVNFEDYNAIISFVNIKQVHWKFVYVHAMSKTIFVIDPRHGTDEMKEATQACEKFGEYFKMRRNQYGREDWLEVKWQPGQIKHTFQADGTSCGVFVMQMANLVVQQFPQIPDTIAIDPTKESICLFRRKVAEEILKSSVSREEYCSICGNDESPQKEELCIWVQCDKCKRWFHMKCLNVDVPKEEETWFCWLCI